MTVSPSRSLLVAVAVITSLEPGVVSSIDTDATGIVLSTVTGEDVTGALSSRPSLATTRTRIASPLPPLPAVAMFSVAPVAPEMSTLFFDHW